MTTDLVCRSRLHERLDQALQTPLALVCAPAGYGKSMLVSHWLETSGEPHAWLSLDRSDSDLTTFVNYILAAVRTVHPGACPETESLVTSRNPISTELVGGTLVNEIDSIDTPFALALDDYQRIDRSSPVHDLLHFILQHPPRQMRIVLMTRRDPPLPLASLRGSRQLTEVRLQELRFNLAELSEFLEKVFALTVSTDAVAGLESQTEGWAVGVRLVGLYLRQVEDPEAFLRGLQGATHHAGEYLLQEALSGQSASMRDWLLRTSILDRFCAGLCDAVCAPDDGPSDLDGRQFVDALRQQNLFVISLDSGGEWFRYHHLFQELLEDQLKIRATPAEMASYHTQASAWLESDGSVEEAMDHAIEAGDDQLTADIFKRNWRVELDADHWYVGERWLAKVPTEIVHQAPELLLASAWAKYFRFQLEAVSPVIDQVESLLSNGPADTHLSAELAFFRSCFRYWTGEPEASARDADAALSQLSATGGIIEGNIQLYRGMARCMKGDRDSALEILRDRLRTIDTSDPSSCLLSCHLSAAQIFVHLFSGDLSPIIAEGQRMQAAAQKSRSANMDAWCSYLRALGHLHSFDLDAARQHLAAAVQHRYLFEPEAAIDSLAGLALTQQLMQDTEAATTTLGQLGDFVRDVNDPRFFSLPHSCRARLALLRGDPASAMEWAQSFGDPLDLSMLFCWLESLPITQARVLIAAGSKENLERATESLEEVRRLSETYHFSNQTIEAAVLQSLALARQDRTDEALVALDEAVSLAEPGGWIRPFVEAGPAMVALLKRGRRRGAAKDFVDRVLAAVPSRGAAASAGPFAPSAGPSLAEDPLDLDAMTDREIEILEFLRQRLQNKEIADRLFISNHTVNDHLKHIYQKLDVHSRRQAVRRAAELGLLDRDSRG